MCLTLRDQPTFYTSSDRGGGSYGAVVKMRLVVATNIISVYYLIKRLHIEFGCSRAVLKFGGWQLKNGKKICMK